MTKCLCSFHSMSRPSVYLLPWQNLQECLSTDEKRTVRQLLTSLVAGDTNAVVRLHTSLFGCPFKTGSFSFFLSFLCERRRLGREVENHRVERDQC
mmetsp:Transcript_3915/g.11715  ORF Transcript_3915/g.11715 Transcript_3915/m.11715 type:complete len:96 (+) Transcript_3915:827-1114(+)